jgi:predicted Zn-dependent protease
MSWNWLSRLRQGLSVRKGRARPARAGSRRGPLHLEHLESRLVPYTTSGASWPSPQLVTLSFVPDGTLISTDGANPVYSNLFATFNARFGSAAAWQKVIFKAAQTWTAQTNLNLAVVGDSGAPVGSGSYQQGDPTMGDIRIGGYSFGNSYLAQAFMPPPLNNYSIAGDIQFNTAQPFNTNGSAYDLFTVAAHELGHALGLYGSPNVSAEMYEVYYGVKSTFSTDDVNGIRAIYSHGQPRSQDPFGANTSFATATDVTSTVDATTLTGVVSSSLDSTTDQDYFTFVAPSGSAGA